MAKALRQEIIWDLQGSKYINLEHRSGGDREMVEDRMPQIIKINCGLSSNCGFIKCGRIEYVNFTHAFLASSN